MRAQVRNTMAPCRATISLKAGPDRRSRYSTRRSASQGAGDSATFALILLGKYPAPGGVLAKSVGFFFVSGQRLVEEPLEQDGRVTALRKLEGQRHLFPA